MKERFFLACVTVLFVVGCGSQPQQGGGGPNGGIEEPAGEHLVLTEANFDEKVLSSDQPVLVDFFATWCPPCKVMAPIVAEVADDYQGRAVVGQLDVDQNRAIAQRYGITSIPTFILFNNDGEIVDRVVGGTSKGALTGMLDAALAP